MSAEKDRSSCASASHHDGARSPFHPGAVYRGREACIIAEGAGRSTGGAKRLQKAGSFGDSISPASEKLLP